MQNPDNSVYTVTQMAPIRIKFSEINRFKKTRGFSRKELARPERKYAELEHWKRAKSVEIQRQSRYKNSFDGTTETILNCDEWWPYDGNSNYLNDLRRKNPLGAGW